MENRNMTLGSLFTNQAAANTELSQGAQTQSSGTPAITPDFHLYGVILGTIAVQKYPDVDVNNIAFKQIQDSCFLGYGFAKLGYQAWIQGERTSVAALRNLRSA